MKRTPFLQSFVHALSGLRSAWSHERNLRVHLAFATAVCALAGWLRVTPGDWAILVLTIAAVIAGELVNTSLESIVDLVSPERQQLAKRAKDVAAGMVLVLAAAAVLIGLLLLGPPLYSCLAN